MRFHDLQWCNGGVHDTTFGEHVVAVVVSKSWEPFTQCCGVMSQKNGYLNLQFIFLLMYLNEDSSNLIVVLSHYFSA
jgi:hypothetical protein